MPINKKRGKLQKGYCLNKSEELQKELLAANFTAFPGDVGKFDDETLQRKGFLEQFRKLKKELEKQSVFDDLDAGLMAADLPPVAIREVYRWFCLVHLQNKLRLAEIKRLEQQLGEIYEENWELRDQLSEGAASFRFGAVIQGRGAGELDFAASVRRNPENVEAARPFGRKDEELAVR